MQVNILELLKGRSFLYLNGYKVTEVSISNKHQRIMVASRSNHCYISFQAFEGLPEGEVEFECESIAGDKTKLVIGRPDENVLPHVQVITEKVFV